MQKNFRNIGLLAKGKQMRVLFVKNIKHQLHSNFDNAFYIFLFAFYSKAIEQVFLGQVFRFRQVKPDYFPRFLLICHGLDLIFLRYN